LGSVTVTTGFVPPAEPEATGVAIGVIGGKGGDGTTTLACHLSAELRGLGNADVLLADLDLYAGQVAFLMKASSEYSILDGLANLHRLDGDFWASLVATGLEGVKVICSPKLHEQGSVPFPAERLRYLVRFLKKQYERIVIDLGRMNAISLSLIAEMNSIVAVTTSDVQALYETRQLLTTLAAAGVPKDHVRLIVNRTAGKMLLPQEDIEKILRRQVEAVLPNSEAELIDAYSAGTLLPEKAALRRHVARLAADIGGYAGRQAKESSGMAEFLKGKLRQFREDASACSVARNSEAAAESRPS
jgi:pilus assembly protein CpaE